MKKIYLHKAETLDDEVIEDVEIYINQDLKKDREQQIFRSMKEVDDFFKIDATALYNALKNHCPQGMRHQLLILLMNDTENHFIIR